MRAERFRVVSVLDEELDFDYRSRLDYATTRDFNLVKLKPGGKPIIYHVREVPHGLWEEYVDAPDAFAEKWKRAFQCGIEKVEHLPQSDGTELSTWAPSHKHPRTGATILSDEDIRMFSPAERQEIGSVIYNHSFLPRRTTATYLLPSSLQEPLTSWAVRHAVVNQPSAAQMTSGASSEHSTPHPEKIEPTSARLGSDSGNHTHVHAAAANVP